MKLLAFLMMCGLANAAVVSSVSCSVQNQPPQNAEYDCSAGARIGSIGFAIAHSEPVELFGVFASWGAFAGSLPPPEFEILSANATVSITRTETVLTEGPVRPGLALITWMAPERCPVNSNAGCLGVLQFGQHSVSVFNLGTECSFTTCLLNTPIFLPVALGETIDIEAHIRGIGPAGMYGNALGETSLNISFTLFEADGQTPVAWSLVHTPEPSTWLLCAVGFTVMLRKLRS